ncbi:hypothetical protein KAS08_05025 [Candidatus Pacearchaeota archaeon]|nr:hypothetical protein [Candidatus Pacearchaeota archaeon]
MVELKSVDTEKKLKRKDFLEEIEKATNEEYITEWDSEGKIGIQKKKSNVKRGAVSKSAGNAFEAKVRKDLIEKGWIVDKWSNNLDLDTNSMHPCKRTFKRFAVGKGVMTIGTGFPDFISFSRKENGDYKIIGVEVKMNGKLSREEKEKCAWYLERKIFSEILVASKIKERNRVRVEYKDFLEIQKRMR